MRQSHHWVANKIAPNSHSVVPTVVCRGDLQCCNGHGDVEVALAVDLQSSNTESDCAPEWRCELATRRYESDVSHASAAREKDLLRLLSSDHVGSVRQEVANLAEDRDLESGEHVMGRGRMHSIGGGGKVRTVERVAWLSLKVRRRSRVAATHMTPQRVQDAAAI